MVFQSQKLDTVGQDRIEPSRVESDRTGPRSRRSISRLNWDHQCPHFLTCLCTLTPLMLASPTTFIDHFSLPWNQETLLGYILETVFFVVETFSYFLINGTFLILFISLCLHNRAFYQMFQHTIREWEESNANQNDSEFLCKLINFQVTVKT